MTIASSSKMNVSITTPRGFSAEGITAGLKFSGKPDMALVINHGPKFVAAGQFTKNKMCAAPVRLTKKNISDGSLKAIIYNSGNANACTGDQGIIDADLMAQHIAAGLNLQATDVAVCSTGIIGETLPMPGISTGMDRLIREISRPDARTVEAGHRAARAIMTTDKKSKEAAYFGSDWIIAGMAKGAGMLAPSLATMLVCITTDAVITSDLASKALRYGVSMTFERLDVDGSTSTNDTVLLLASGASGVVPDEEEFFSAIRSVCDDLAEAMQDDAEGVTKRVSVTVTGALSESDALNSARAICRDTLFKCAMFGSDPNWGRVIAALGMADADMDIDNISVDFNGEAVCRKSCGIIRSGDVDLSGSTISVHVDLGLAGKATATIRTTDLSHRYVEINSAYRT